MIKSTLFFIILITSISRCAFSQADDTVCTFNVINKTFKVHLYQPLFDLNDFQTFLNSITNSNFKYTKIKCVDVTEDGINDSCITTISLKKDLPFVENKIISNHNLIWYDTLLIRSEQVAASNWGEDSSYYELMPYSGLYLANKYFSELTGKAVDSKSPEFSYFINVLNKDKGENWVKRFRQYKGLWIWCLNIVGGGGMIWDTESQKFIPYWGE